LLLIRRRREARSGAHPGHHQPSADSSPYQLAYYDRLIRRLTTPPYPYLIFHEVAETEIIVHAIRHGARNPSGMPGSA
jgi:plasmid stabilization system protein ParE